MERGWLIVLLILPAASAATEPILEDAAGDVQFEAAGQDGGSTPVGGEAADGLALAITEQAETLMFELTTASVSPQNDYVVQHLIHFSHGDTGYLLRMTYIAGVQSSWRWALQTGSDGTGWHSFAFGDTEVDASSNVLTATLPRDLILDSNGGAPRPGSPLHSIWVASYANDMRLVIAGATGAGWAWHDAMGEDSPATLPMQLGIEQQGDLRLESATPYRSSNGEATTFLFQMTLRNLGTEQHIVTLAAREVPAGWDVVFPVDVIRLEGGKSADLAVVISTPFAHRHGDLDRLLVEASGPDGHVGRIELGVRYPAIPQPAGHHDRLYIHSREGPQDAFAVLFYALNEALVGAGSMQVATMNTLEDDPLDEGVPVEAAWCGTEAGTAVFAPVFCWPTVLSPGLAMGLDFDMTREGTLNVAVENLLPAPSKIGGSLVWLGPPEGEAPFVVRESIVLATIEGNLVELPAAGQTNLEARIIPQPEADYVPFQPGASIMLDLQLMMDRPDNFFLGPRADKPVLLPGGELRLPLLEYQDPIDDVFGGQGILELSAADAHRLVNPGKTAVFNLTATNHGSAPAKATLRLIGNSDGWASLPYTALDLPAGGSKQVPVVVSVSKEASDGQRLDLIVEISATDNIERMLVRIVAEVDVDAEHPDDAPPAPAGKSKDSPGLGVLMPLLLAFAWGTAQQSKRS